MSHQQTPTTPVSPVERADAARNRQLILDATRVLYSTARPSPVTLEEITAAAGVGKGTVYRRFGDLGGLLEALIAGPVESLRAAVEAGPPPIGPGAAPEAALEAFVDALLDFVWTNRHPLRALESRVAHAYYNNDTSQFWIAELRRPLAAVRADRDVGHLAYVIFTSMRADVLEYLQTHEGMSRERIRRGVHQIAESY